jgi:hypothetical protein
MVLSRNRQALTGDVSIRVEDEEIIAGKKPILHSKPGRVSQFGAPPKCINSMKKLLISVLTA